MVTAVRTWRRLSHVSANAPCTAVAYRRSKEIDRLVPDWFVLSRGRVSGEREECYS